MFHVVAHNTHPPPITYPSPTPLLPLSYPSPTLTYPHLPSPTLTYPSLIHLPCSDSMVTVVSQKLFTSTFFRNCFPEEGRRRDGGAVDHVWNTFDL